MAIRIGKDNIRLDCQVSNEKLNQYYKKLGYKYVGTVKEGNYVGNKREKNI